MKLRVEPKIGARAESLTRLQANLYDFYGLETGFRVARKHIAWYTRGLVGSASFRHHMNQLPNIEQQMQAVNDFFCQQADQGAHLKYISEEALAA